MKGSRACHRIFDVSVPFGRPFLLLLIIRVPGRISLRSFSGLIVGYFAAALHVPKGYQRYLWFRSGQSHDSVLNCLDRSGKYWKFAVQCPFVFICDEVRGKNTVHSFSPCPLKCPQKSLLSTSGGQKVLNLLKNRWRLLWPSYRFLSIQFFQPYHGYTTMVNSTRKH